MRPAGDAPDAATPPEAEGGADDVPADATTDALADDESPAPGAVQDEAFGPPLPPAWFLQAEDEAAFAACRLALSLLGTSFEVQPPVTDPDNHDCGIARPIQVKRILPGVALTGEPVMRCDTARALGFWTRDFLRPAAALLPGAPQLTALETGRGYTCRERVGTGEAQPKPSEHANGNAIDIAGFRFAEPVFEEVAPDDMSFLPVTPRTGEGDLGESFQRAARGTACLLFTTVLGPGSNAAHDDHLHLDVAERNNGWRLCE